MDGHPHRWPNVSKDDVLRDFATGSNRLLDGHVDDLNVRIFGDFAVVAGRTHAQGEYRDHPYDVTLRFTDVFVRRGEEWQLSLPMPAGLPSTIVRGVNQKRTPEQQTQTKMCLPAARRAVVLAAEALDAASVGKPYANRKANRHLLHDGQVRCSPARY
jgi:Domain of unknown function (DUF4440)